MCASGPDILQVIDLEGGALDTSLGVRNFCAHLSGIAVRNMKVIASGEALVEKVVLRYEV